MYNNMFSFYNSNVFVICYIYSAGKQGKSAGSVGTPRRGGEGARVARVERALPRAASSVDVRDKLAARIFEFRCDVAAVE